MSHSLDFDGIYEKLILLQHYSFGSKKYCSERLIGSSKDIGNEKYDSYWGWTKGIISNYTIECSIKYRLILDIIENKEDIVDLDKLDKISIENLNIGDVLLGDFNLSLRESCNKIIHSKKAVPIWAKSTLNGVKFYYWTGKYKLTGKHKNKDWEVLLNINQWAFAMERFFDLFESSDAYLYMGQDWY